MAIVILNPILRSLSGRIGNFVFYTRHSIQCVRIFVEPRNPRTACQQNNRGRFADAVRSWQSLPAYKQTQWNNNGSYKRRSGYNLFISHRMRFCGNDVPVTKSSSVRFSFVLSSDSPPFLIQYTLYRRYTQPLLPVYTVPDAPIIRTKETILSFYIVYDSFSAASGSIPVRSFARERSSSESTLSTLSISVKSLSVFPYCMNKIQVELHSHFRRRFNLTRFKHPDTFDRIHKRPDYYFLISHICLNNDNGGIFRKRRVCNPELLPQVDHRNPRFPVG